MVEVQQFEVVGAGDLPSVLDVLIDRLGLRVDLDEDVSRTSLDTAGGAIAAAGAVLEHRLSTDGTAAVVWVQGGRTVCRIDDVVREIPTTVEGIGLPERLETVAGGAALVPTGRIASRVVTLSRTDDEDKTTVRLVVDGSLDEDGRTLPILLEVFPLRGYDRDAERLVDGLRELVALRATTGTSTDRVRTASSTVTAETAETAETAVASVAGTMTAGMTAAAGWRSALQGLTTVLSARFPGVLADEDVEELHDFRVAVRRIRTLLRDGSEVLGAAERQRFRSDLLWLGDVTTPARDADVHLLDLPGLVAALPADRRGGLEPLLDLLRARRDDAHDRLVRELRSARRDEFGRAWAAWLDDDSRWTDGIGRRSGEPLAIVAASVARRAHRRLVSHGRAIDRSTPAEALHEMRKDAKRLRYLLECFAPVFDADSVETVTARLRRVQDVLGTFQDAAVQARSLQGLAVGAGAPDVDGRDTIDGVIGLLEGASRHARHEVAGLFVRFDDRKVRRAMDRLDGSRKGRTR